MISKGRPVLFFVLFCLIYSSCTKVNEATNLGDDLIPAVDNINTFDTTFTVNAAYYPFNDTSRHFYSDNMALGIINDGFFGSATANMYLNFGSTSAYKTYPFGVRDSFKVIDSVVLSLGYQGGYGDTAEANVIGVQVREIAANNDFKDDSAYKFNQPAFTTNASVLGTKSFTLKSLKDSITIFRKGDTTKAVNVLRIRLNNSIGERLRSFDTSASAITGGYSSDSAFRALFRGLEVKAVSAGSNGALAYFNILSPDTKLLVYYKVGRTTGVDSGASVTFIPFRSDIQSVGTANLITRNPGGAYLAGLGTVNPDRLYLQSSPAGSYIGMKIPGLDLFPNKVIHRAELITFKVPSSNETIFTVPSLLLLDHKGSNGDSSYIFERDLLPSADGSSLDFSAFGGRIRNDNSYRFNLTRYVQGIVTRKQRNDSLRLYAPLRNKVYATTTPQFLTILDNIARGRVILTGSTFSDPSRRLQLRVIYSNL